MDTVENLRSKGLRYLFNLAPVFRATGAWLTHVSGDLRQVELRLPLKAKTRNPMGTMCGGNMYSAVHGIYQVMLTRNLGRSYLCLDRRSTIDFLKPGRGTLYARFELTQDEIDAVQATVERDAKTDRDYQVELKDGDGTVCGRVSCVVHVRRSRRVVESAPA